MDSVQEKMLRTIATDVELVKKAVLGEPAIGLDGLVTQVNRLNRWRSKIELRAATVAGGVTALLWFIEHFVSK